jgi:Transketolase, C-terminal subunit
MTEATTFDCRDAWAATLTQLGQEDPRIIAVVNDSVGSSKLDGFRAALPNQTVNVGIAEQNMVGVGAGLAGAGKIPFVSAAGSFLCSRSIEQVKIDVAYAKRNVKLVAQSPGVAYGELGPTHHSIEDFAWMRVIPGLITVAPADPLETEQVIRWAAKYDGPVYIRVSRMGVPAIYPEEYQFAPGKATELHSGNDVTIIASGTTVCTAMDTAKYLESEGIHARVLSMPTIKPLDEQAILCAAEQTGKIVTVEEALVSGLGGAVAELLAENLPTPMRRVGFQDKYAITGSTKWLFEHHGISVDGISSAVRSLLGR